MRKWNVDVQTVERVLGRLAAVYRCDRLRMLGGEPLLHPDFVDVAAVAKAAKIGRIVQLTTNGMLIDRLPDEGWRLLDEIEISVYPAAGLTDERLLELRRKGERFGTRVNVSKYPRFRGTFTTQKAKSAEIVQDVWSACKAVNVWGCHAVRGERIYRCPQSAYGPVLNGGSFSDEGFEIDDRPDLRERLLDFLNAPGPLGACAYCVGTCGKKLDHGASSRRDWMMDLGRPYEEMIDYELLEISKVERREVDDCRRPVRARRSLGGRLVKKVRELL